MIDVFLREDDSYKDFILKKVSSSFNRLRKFFPVAPNLFSVHLVYSRKEFDRMEGKKTERWQVGHAKSSKNEIYVFSPLVFEKESSHKKEDFSKVLTHEMAHIFTYQIYPYFEPRWLVEGLAYYVAGQNGGKNAAELLKKDFLFCLDTGEGWRENLKKGAYGLSFLWVKFLVETFGKEKLFELMKKCDFPYQREKFLKAFKDVYGEEMSFFEEKFRKRGGDKNGTRKNRTGF